MSPVYNMSRLSAQLRCTSVLFTSSRAVPLGLLNLRPGRIESALFYAAELYLGNGSARKTTLRSFRCSRNQRNRWSWGRERDPELRLALTTSIRLKQASGTPACAAGWYLTAGKWCPQPPTPTSRPTPRGVSSAIDGGVRQDHGLLRRCFWE